MKNLEINIPEGYILDKENSTFDKVIFKKIENSLPDKWEKLNNINGFYIGVDSVICQSEKVFTQEENKNIFPEEKYAKAAVALAQLLQLRQVYNNGWEPDWSNENTEKLYIGNFGGFINVNSSYDEIRVLSFKDKETIRLFIKNFKDLLEIAKPLL